ncbi:MAG: carboxylating nicotinate-nucleotide diphosphorylase [Oligoflexia bacterium]|nr:carboxylating nicotinate-nucleotide diphosphorylase [Oligoflexia bacterium]
MKNLILQALKEDMPLGDITTDSLELGEKPGTARLIAKENLILSGQELFEETFKAVSPKCVVTWNYKDSNYIPKDQLVAQVQGPLDALLKAERCALNFLCHLSGIATYTFKFIEKLKSTDCKITDTRKTTPGLRILEKKAVKDGGGVNHRFSLSEFALIKENHIRSAGSITKAFNLVRKSNPKVFIEIEVTNLNELDEALACNPSRIMLDNMKPDEIKKAVMSVNKKCELEASGNMSLDKVAEIAKLGVDYISVGAITHSAPVADLSLLFEY